MSNESGYSPEDVSQAMADLIVLGEFSVEFARVDRKPVYPDGRQQRTAWLKRKFSNPDFEFLFDLRDALSQEITDTLFVEAPEQN